MATPAPAASGAKPVAGKHLAYITEKEAKLLEVLNLHDSDPGNDFKHEPGGGKPTETMVLANAKEQKTLKKMGGSGKKTPAGMKSFVGYNGSGGGPGPQGSFGGYNSPSSSSSRSSGPSGGMGPGDTSRSSSSRSGSSYNGSGGGTGDRGTPGMNQGSNSFKGGTSPSSPGSDGKGNTPTGQRGTPGMNQGSNPVNGPTKSADGKGDRPNTTIGKTPGPVGQVGRPDQTAYKGINQPANVTFIDKTPPRSPNTRGITPPAADPTNGIGRFSRLENSGWNPDPAGYNRSMYPGADPTNGIGRTPSTAPASPPVRSPADIRQDAVNRTRNTGVLGTGYVPSGPYDRYNPGNYAPSTPVSSLSKLATVNADPTNGIGKTPAAPAAPAAPDGLFGPRRLSNDPRYQPQTNMNSQIYGDFVGNPVGKVNGQLAQTEGASPVSNVTKSPLGNVTTADKTDWGNDVSQNFVDKENAAAAHYNQIQGPYTRNSAPSRVPGAETGTVSSIRESIGPGEGNVTSATWNAPPAPSGGGMYPGETLAGSQLATSFLNNQNLQNPGGLTAATESGDGTATGGAVSDLPPIDQPPVDPLPTDPPVIGGPTPPVFGGGGVTSGGAPGQMIPGSDPPPVPTGPGPGIAAPMDGIMPWDREAFTSLQAIMQGMGVTYTPDQFVQQFYQQGNEPAPPPINYVRPKVAPIPVESGQPLVQSGA